MSDSHVSFRPGEPLAGRHGAVPAFADGRADPTLPIAAGDRQSLPLAYLEQLFVPLRRAGLVESARGRSGGYRLAKSAAQISIAAVMDAVEIAAAREALRLREGISEERANSDIGSWTAGEKAPDLIVDLPQWAAAHGVEAVVWTLLGPRFAGRAGHVPTPDQVIAHLAGLTGTARDNAERYIRHAPRQIDTAYRRRIEVDLHWMPLDPPR